MNLGGVTIEFIDSENKITETETDIFGYFSVELEQKKYRISSKDYSLLLSGNSDKIYDFRDEKNRNFLTLEVFLKPGFISGRTIDNFNNSIPFSKIIITSGDFSKNIISDEFGYFSLELSPGIFRISASSKGFINKSMVRNLLPASSIPNLSMVLEKNFFSLEGYVTDGVEPLENLEVKVISEKGITLKRTLTSEKGKFFLGDISSFENIYILIESENYIFYQSEPIQIDKNIIDFYIPLIKKDKIR
ncbi:MAG: carboxypeptidase-like regulatory domain-containing protein [Fusobacteriaceae bacterium]